jgi:hypothetical protein
MESPEAPARRAEWRDATIQIGLAFVVSRLLLVLVAVVLEQVVPLAYHGPTFSQAPILRSLTGSDAVYYLGIAGEGYHLDPVRDGYHDWAFFPLYPLAGRATSFLTLGDLAVAGVVVANVAFVAAAAVLYLLAKPALGHDDAVRSVIYLSIAPGAVAFAMAYSDSLYLLLAAAAFLAAERKRWPLAAGLYALAALCRLPGLLLVVPLALIAIRGRSGWQPLIFLLAGPIAVAAFYGYLGIITGDFLANLHAQSAWTIPPVLGGDVSGAAPGTSAYNPLPILLIATLLFYTFLLVYIRADRMPPAHMAFAVLSLVTVVGSLRLQSVARYLAVAWPFSWILAKRGPRVGQFWLVASSGLFVLHAILHFTQALAP